MIKDSEEEKKQSDNFVIRKMKISDYDRAYQLWQGTEGMGLSSADSRVNIKKFLKLNYGLCFVSIVSSLREKDRLVGTILAGQDGRRGYIYHLAVDAEYREKGIGSELTNRCLQALKERGIAKVHLMVYAENINGRKFWQRANWVERKELVIYSYDTISS